VDRFKKVSKIKMQIKERWPMKTAINAAIVSFMVFVSFILASCDSPGSGMKTSPGSGNGNSSGTGTITLNLSGNSSRVAYNPKCEHQITLESFKEDTHHHTLSPGVTTANFTVATGLWKITIKAQIGASLYAMGSENVDVKTGQKNSVRVDMTRVYNIGEKGPGDGIIFYSPKDKNGIPKGFTITDTGETCYYLEAAPSDIPVPFGVFGFAWDIRGNNIPPIFIKIGTGTGIGAGRNNTKKILNSSLIPSVDVPAAYLCDNYISTNGKDDWFLPSSDELLMMLNNLHPLGLGGFNTSQPYWSSTENSTTPNAIVNTVDLPPSPFPSWSIGSVNKWWPRGQVRPIRAF